MREEDIFAKLGMKRKKKWSLENPTKRTNWKSVSSGKGVVLQTKLSIDQISSRLMLYS